MRQTYAIATSCAHSWQSIGHKESLRRRSGNWPKIGNDKRSPSPSDAASSYLLLLLLFLFLPPSLFSRLVAFGLACVWSSSRGRNTGNFSSVRIRVGRDHVELSQPSPAHCMKSGTSLTGTSLAKAFTFRFRSSVSRTTSRLKRRGCPSSTRKKSEIPNFLHYVHHLS